MMAAAPVGAPSQYDTNLVLFYTLLYYKLYMLTIHKTHLQIIVFKL